MTTWLRKRLRKEEKGFTLIELMVVVAIIALLAVFAVPRVFDAIQQAKGARGNNDLSIIQAALDRFYMDHDFYPNTLQELIDRKYLKHNIKFENGHGRRYLYAVNNNTVRPVWDGTSKYSTKGGATAYFLADPGKSPGTDAEICTVKDANGKYTKALPEGKSMTSNVGGTNYTVEFAWKTASATPDASTILYADVTCGTVATTIPDTLHSKRTDGYTE